MSQLIAGRTIACGEGGCSGGIAEALALANACEVTSVQFDVDGIATGITMEAAATFYLFDFKEETAVFNESGDNSGDSFAVTQTFEMIWRCRNHPDRNLIMDMANNLGGMVAIHVENTGVAWIWGYLNKQRVKLQTVESTSGAALLDANQTTLTLQAIAKEMAAEFGPGYAGIPLS